MKRSLVLRGAVGAALVAASPRRVVAQTAPLRVGLIFSYTGGSATTGAGVDAAIKTYLAQHGNAPGGRPIQIIRRDDGGIAPDVARRLAQELIVQERVDILMGCVYTPNAIAVADVSTQAKVPYFVINSATSNILAKNPYSARFGFTNAQITPPLAQFVLRNGLKSAYILYQNYAPGVDAAKSFSTTFTAGGGRVLGEIAMPVNTTDFTPFIQRVKDEKPQVLFVFINGGGSGPLFLKACREAGLRKLGIQIVSSDDLVDENDLIETGEAAFGAIAALNYTSTHASAVNYAFVRAFAANNKGRLPEYTNVAAYDIMTAIAHIASTQSGAVDAEKAIAAVRNLAFESPRGPIRIDPQTRDIVQNVYIRRVERIGGKLSYREIETIPMLRDPLEK
jgi:branched-chain amino acid transport system substrate-binding protein